MSNNMRFIKIINKKKFTLISIFLLLYVIINLFEGDRGLISYYEKRVILKQLTQKQNILNKRLSSIKIKNSLLTENLNLDYLETLYRKKFMVGKPREKIYISK